MIINNLSRKQIIILMSTDNLEAIITQANSHIANINRLLKNVKSDISANYICSNNRGIVITTNKAVFFSDLNIVERCYDHYNLYLMLYRYLPYVEHMLKFVSSLICC